MACGALTAMRSLIGALRFGHREGAARHARDGGGRGDGHAGRVSRGREHHEAPGQQASRQSYRSPGPSRGPGPHGGRLGQPPGLRPRQGRWDVPAVCACREAPETVGPPAARRGCRGPRPRAPRRRLSPGRCRAAGPRCWRTPAPGTGADPDERVLAARPARHPPRCPRARFRGSNGKPVATAGGFKHVRIRLPKASWTPRTSRAPGSGRSATTPHLPAGHIPRRTRPGAPGPGQPSAAAAWAARRADAAPPRLAASRCRARLVHPAARPALRATRPRPASPVRAGTRSYAVARTPGSVVKRPPATVKRPPATARSRPGRASGSARPGIPAGSGKTAARASRRRRVAAPRPWLSATGQRWLPLAGQPRPHLGQPWPRTRSPGRIRRPRWTRPRSRRL